MDNYFAAAARQRLTSKASMAVDFSVMLVCGGALARLVVGSLYRWYVAQCAVEELQAKM